MKGFCREAQKTLLRLPCLILLLAALFLNACLFYTQSSGEMAENSAYKKANAYLQGLSEAEGMRVLANYQNALEIGEWEGDLLFSEDLLAEEFLVREFQERLQQIEDYPEYLQGIQDKAKQQEISIFQNTSVYTKRYLQASARAFRPLEGTQLRFVNSDTFLHATEFRITDILALAVLFYLVVSMVVYEKEHGLFPLLRAAKEGRGALIRSKMLVGAATAMFLSLLFWLENLGIAVWKYGTLDVSAPLQSVYGYDGSALHMNIGQYLLLFLFSKVAVYMVISFFILLLGMRAETTMGIYLGALLVIGFSLVCYSIGVYSGFRILHYCNLLFLVEVFSAYKFYFSLNFFQYPIPILCVFWVFLVVLGGVLWYGNWKIFTGKNFMAEFKAGRKWKSKTRKRPNVHLICHEMYKLFISNRGWLLLCLLLILQVWMYGQRSTYLYLDEHYYKQYMEYMQGELDEEKEKFIVQEQEMFIKYETLLVEKQQEYEEKKISEAEMLAVNKLVSQKIEPKAAFEHLLERVDYARTYQLPLLYETGYLELFGYGFSGYQEDMLEALLLVVFLILLLAPYCAGEYEQGMMILVSSQYAGRRKTLLAKGVISLFVSILVYLLIYIPRLLYIAKLYGYAGMEETVDAIPEMAGGLLHCSIGTYMVWVYLLRFLMVVTTAAFILAVSVNRKNIIQSVSGLFVILALPMALHIMGIEGIDYCSLNALYSVNRIFHQGRVGVFLFWLCILLVLFGLSVIYLIETIGREEGHGRKRIGLPLDK